MHTRVAQQVSFILNHRKNKTTRENFGMRRGRVIVGVVCNIAHVMLTVLLVIS